MTESDLTPRTIYHRVFWLLVPLRLRRLDRDWIVEARWRGCVYQWMVTMDGLVRM